MGFFSSLVDGVYGVIVFLAESLYMTLFGISPLYTEGVWPFGRPVGPSGGDPNILISGEAVAYAGVRAYDAINPIEGGGILIFSIFVFFFAYVVGGYLQFFDWKIDNPDRKRDPVNGVFLMLLWFPIYYGFVGVVHAIMLSIPLNLQDFQLLMQGFVVSTGVNVGIGKLVALIGLAGLVVMMFVMLMRPIVIGVYFLFGQPLIAIAWADVPKASDVAHKLLIKSIPVALVPIPMYMMMFGFTFAVTGIDVLGYELGGWFAAEVIVFTTGVYFFTAAVWITLWLMWLVFTRTGQYVEQAGSAVGQVGGTLGLVAAGRPEDAKRAARYGPESVIGREAMKRTSNWRGERGSRSDGDTEGRSFVDRVKWWGGDDGSRK